MEFHSLRRTLPSLVFALTLMAVFSMTDMLVMPSQAQTFEVLYTFQGPPDGSNPQGGLLRDNEGNLYGTTAAGGSLGGGTVYKLSPSGVVTVLHNFGAAGDGASPLAGLVRDAEGNFYGTTQKGGDSACGSGSGCGTVFKVDPSGNETVLHNFGESSGDGLYPSASLVLADGIFFGTTSQGGSELCSCGTVFQITTSGAESVVYSFDDSYRGGSPRGSLFLDGAGTLYGTTFLGGVTRCPSGLGGGCGTIYKLTGASGYALIHSFTNIEGDRPAAGLTGDSTGNLYGTTTYGPHRVKHADGDIFEVDSAGAVSTLHSFNLGENGAGPVEISGALVRDNEGNLYGTSQYGGIHDCGTIFELDASSNFSILYSFACGPDGETPTGNLILNGGLLYGTASKGGVSNNGVVFVVNPSGPRVRLQMSSLNFGNQTVSKRSTPHILGLRNIGTGALLIKSINITGPDSSDFSGTSNCPPELQGGGKCDIDVVFTPATTGKRTATLNITDNALGSPQTVPLLGVGVLPNVTITPTSLSFPTQVVFTTSPVKKVVLTNNGNGALEITAWKVTGDFFSSTDCGKTVNPGTSCNLYVHFRPKSKGSLSGEISITDNDPGSPQIVPLSGTGTFVELSPLGLHFGNQPVGTQSAPQTITLSNKGDATLNITSIGVAGTNQQDFAQNNDCGQSVASGGRCTITVTFTPMAQGKRTAEIVLNDDGGGSPQSVPLTGTGTQ